jgi:hypothetical protein
LGDAVIRHGREADRRAEIASATERGNDQRSERTLVPVNSFIADGG